MWEGELRPGRGTGFNGVLQHCCPLPTPRLSPKHTRRHPDTQVQKMPKPKCPLTATASVQWYGAQAVPVPASLAAEGPAASSTLADSPHMVYVFPLPVAPYAKMVVLMP